MLYNFPVDVLRYESERYKKPDQRLIDRFEKRTVADILNKISPIGSILDIPCGYGRFAKLLMRFSKQYLPADIDMKMVKRVEEKYGTKGVVADITSLPFESLSFDLIFTIRLFQHFENDEKLKLALSEIYRISKRWALFSFYRTTMVHVVERKIFHRKSKITMRKVSLLKHMLKEEGFRIIFMHPLIDGFHSQTLVLVEKG